MTPTQCKLQTASPIGLLISFHFSGTAGLLSGPPSYCYLRNCHDPIIIFCMTDIWSYKCKLKLTWPDFVHIKSITSEIKLLLNMFVIRSSKAVPNWLAHFSKTQRHGKPSKTFEDNGREARSFGIKQILCSFCRSSIGQFSFKISARRHPCRCVVFRPRKPVGRWMLDNEMNKFLKFPTSETCRRIGTSFGRSDVWDRLSGQALVMIGRWYSRQPLTNHK